MKIKNSRGTLFSCVLALSIFTPHVMAAPKKISPEEDFSAFAVLGRALNPNVTFSYFDHEDLSPFSGVARSKVFRTEDKIGTGDGQSTVSTFRFTFNLSSGAGHYCGWYFSVKDGELNFADKSVIRFEIKGTPRIPTDRFQIGVRSKNVPASENQAKLYLSDLGYKVFPTEFAEIEIPVEMLQAREPGLNLQQMNDLIILGVVDLTEDLKDQHIWFRNAKWDWGLTRTDRGLKATLSFVAFETGKADFKPEATQYLDKLATQLKKLTLKSIEIQGHTDNVGALKNNLDLSKRRAQAVADYLTGRGVVAEENIVTLGMGPEKPVASNDTPEGRAKNRRVEVFIK